MGKHDKRKKTETNFKSLIISALIQFLVGLLLIIIEKLLD